MPQKEQEEAMEDVARLFGVLSHPTRVHLLALLHQGEHDVSDLKDQRGILATNASQHLALLRTHHLVKMRRQGTRVYYSIRDPRVATLINCALDMLDEDISHMGEVRKALRAVRLES